VLKVSQKVFRDSLKVSVLPSNPSSKLYYTTDGETPTRESNELKMTEEVTLHKTSRFRVIEVNGEQESTPVSAWFYKIPHNYTVEISSKYNPQYTAGGDHGIIDGVLADEDWRKGGWQGYQSQDFECIVDLQKPISISQVSASFLQDTRSWIVLPTNVEFWYSVDGKTWTSMGNDTPSIEPNDYTVQRWDSRVRLGHTDNKPEPMFIFTSVLARYVKVKAKNYGKLPEWHMGVGGDAFIFIDEITVH